MASPDSDIDSFFQQTFTGILILPSLTSHGADRLGCKSPGLGVQYQQEIVPLSLSAVFLFFFFLQKPWFPLPLSPAANNAYPEPMQSRTTTSTKPTSPIASAHLHSHCWVRHHQGHSLLTPSLPLPFSIHSAINCPNRQI